MEPSPADEGFSVLVLASDLGVDARSLLSADDRRHAAADENDVWHDCLTDTEDFSDLEALQAIKLQGVDKSGRRILRVVGKYLPAAIISGERLKRYVFHKLQSELADGPFCILYMHSKVQSEDNNPGVSIIRWIYEELPDDFKERMQIIYFLHPGLRSRLVIATLGRFFLSGGLYWKIRYISRLQYLWDEIKKEQVEIPDFVFKHDEVLERRPLTDYGIEPDPYHLTGVPAMDYSIGRYDDRWPTQPYL